MNNLFQGHLVRLRAVEAEDWQTHYAWDRAETESARIVDEVWFPPSRRRAQAWAERQATGEGNQGDNYFFQIERSADEMHVGIINTHGCDRRSGTFYYGLSIAPAYRRQGYASEAIRLVLRFYFHERRYQKANAEVYAFNAGSIRLHEKLGFTLEGRLRRMVFTQGAFHDALVYGMTREEFEATGLPCLPQV
ncbi:MAG: GNAT family N-acetyltransferase [Anaerolineae bacterium]|nr:GNAT family N-acetyltransferase [Anaerolineae bacterium]